jgi:hypothetical protein
MLTQQEWVEGCYAYYAENYIEPGNPEDGEWEDAHYPVPKCEGGKVTIKLLKQHHAVHGVLQSEEYQRPCIWGWEANYLRGEMLALCKKWHREKSRQAMSPGQRSEISRRWHETLTPEQRAARAQTMLDGLTTEAYTKRALTREANLTPEQRAERVRRLNEGRTPEQRRAAALRGASARTPEQRSEDARRANAARTPEQRSEAGRKAAETRRRNREAVLLRSVTTP